MLNPSVLKIVEPFYFAYLLISKQAIFLETVISVNRQISKTNHISEIIIKKLSLTNVDITAF